MGNRHPATFSTPGPLYSVRAGANEPRCFVLAAVPERPGAEAASRWGRGAEHREAHGS